MITSIHTTNYSLSNVRFVWLSGTTAPTGARGTLISTTECCITCPLFRSLPHPTTSCPQVNPAIPACLDMAQPKFTSYVPHSATFNADLDSKRSSRPPFLVTGQVCHNFNGVKCSRQCCKYLHACNYCSGAHAIFYAQSKKLSIKNLKITYQLQSIFLGYPQNYPTTQTLTLPILSFQVLRKASTPALYTLSLRT